MRSGFLALCGFLVAQGVLWAQGSGAPVIVANPESVQAFVGDSVTLTARIEGQAPIAFQWRKWVNGAATNITGATATTLTLPSLATTDSGLYDVMASNPLGTVTTVPASLFVARRPQTITFEPPSSVVAGGGLSLNATTSSALPVTYSVVSGSALLIGNVLSGAGGNVVVRATQSGNATFAPADPVERTINFVAGALSPFITSPPLDQTVNAGTTATFRAGAIGTPAPTYQWQKDGVDLAGATTAVLTLGNTTLADSGRYTVHATNLLGRSTAAATLTVRAAPTFTATPEGRTVFAGERVTFTAAATGFPAPTFQWRKNGAAISGATNASLIFAAAAATDAGRYEVVATNLLGSITSPVAMLAVNVRDFTGTYFGQLAGGDGTASGGEFALHVRPNRTAALLAHDPALPAGLVVLNLAIDLNGGFSRAIASGNRTVTVRGALNDATGAVTGEIPEINRTLTGTRTPGATPAAAQAGVYQLALVGSAVDRGYVIIASDGRAFLLSANAAAAEGATGAIANGRLAVATASRAQVDLGFDNGEISGTVRLPTGATGTLAGAIESLAGREHLLNLSIRSTTTANVPLITGFVVSGAAPKQVLIRAAGPTLGQAPFNVPGTLADPTVQVFRGNAIVAQNDEWGTPAANGTAVTAASTRAGAFPFRAGSADAALVTTLAPGPYTVMIGGGNGTTLAEVYEVLENNETVGTRRLVNLSARGIVAPGAPMIAGFVIGGTAPQRVLIRGIGPTIGLPPFNVAGALQNPQLTLFRGTTVVKTNDDWFRDADATLIRDAAARAAAFALGAQSLDAAVLLFLQPGAYTVQIAGPANANQANGTGIALVEVYESTP